MSKRKPVELGGGLIRAVSYKELEALLAGAPRHLKQSILAKHFPEEIADKRERQLAKLNIDRWNQYSHESTANQSKPYWLTHSDLLKRVSRLGGEYKPLNGRHHRVSDFARWIYGLRKIPRDPEALSRGKEGELKVSLRKRRVPQLMPGSGWRLLYCDPLDGRPESLEISLLTVQGRSLYGAPDYVFKNDETGTVLIVEVKVSNRELWSDGWPNLRAQLWAYGHIDRFINDAREIILVGEVWSDDGQRRRQTLTWRLSDPDYYAQNQQLFERYQSWTEFLGT